MNNETTFHDVLSPRDQWKLRGKLYPCPNPSHDFKIGKLVGQWTMAEDCWSIVTSTGNMHNYLIGIHTIEWLTGEKAFSITIWKLKIIMGFMK
jgi:hypothetical protein